jgi:DNA-binding NtrC family response regulator
MTSMFEPENRILIVEDEAIVAIDIQTQLEALGYQVVGVAASGSRALELANTLRPDLVLMDIHIQGSQDGIATALRIRQSLGTPIVFLTANADADTITRAKQVQPYGYIVKPFDERDLHTTLQVAIYKGKADRLVAREHDDMLAILDAQRHGTVLLDAEGRVTFISAAAGRMIGRPVADCVGLAWQEAFGLPTSATQRLAAMIAAPVRDREKVPAETQPRRGSQCWLEIEVQDDQRTPQRRILFFYDVSQLHELRRLVDEQSRFECIVGKSKPIEQVFQLISDFAKVDATVMIEGETGTGKELVARAIHRRSKRSNRPFVALNCAGLSDDLAASQLFGHRRGSFTGAVDDQMGLFEAAHTGTLFLDEIGELPLRVQTTLLRALEERQIMRVGESKLRPVDVRIVTATHRNLANECAEGRFRSDLLYRIRVGRILLPALRERREDIPLLARTFLAEHCATTGKSIDQISDEALTLLMEHDWPGNVRELRNAMEFAVIRATGTAVRAGDLPPEILEQDVVNIDAELSGNDRESILTALTRVGGNRKEAAQLLGMSRATFYRRLTQFGIDTTAAG